MRGYFFFFNDTATTEIYTLSLHDALPISGELDRVLVRLGAAVREERAVEVSGHHLGDQPCQLAPLVVDRKSTRLNSSHLVISYAVFCLQKKNESAAIWRRQLVRFYDSAHH